MYQELWYTSFIISNTMKYLFIALTGCLLYSCSSEPKWLHLATYELHGLNPIGLAVMKDQLWISDSDNNQLVQVGSDGSVVSRDEGYERPMHISSDGSYIYVPEYGKDQITILGDEKSFLILQDSLDAPAGVDVADGKYAIADFYNQRIIYGSGDDWISFGEEGNARGQFYYPTDVQIYKEEIYVADAYNNRIQVFDLSGRYERLFGVNEEINAATGLYVHEDEVFVTDFENDRVIVYTTEGALKQIIEEGIHKPTDMIWFDDRLYIGNYKGKNLMTFQKS